MQRTRLHDSVRSAIHKERRRDRANNGDAVLEIPVRLQVAAGKRNRVAENRHGDRSRDWQAGSANGGRILKTELLERRCWNERNRRNGTDIVPAYILLAAHIEAAIRRNLEAAEPVDIRHAGVEAQHVAFLVHLLVLLEIEDVRNGVDIAPERTAGQRELVQVAFAARWIHRVIDGVVADARGKRARNDPLEGARSGDIPELQLLEEQRGRFVKRLYIRAGESIREADTRERKLAYRITGKDREARAVLRIVLHEFGVDADRLAEQQRLLLCLIEVVAARENGESGGDRPVKKVGFREAEEEAALQIAELRAERQRFAETQEVVRLIR